MVGQLAGHRVCRISSIELLHKAKKSIVVRRCYFVALIIVADLVN
jgi:hypothetical protein